MAKSIKSPVVLILDAKGMSNSAAAIIKGFKDFKEDSMIEGVIFNGISEGLYPLLSGILETIGVKSYGFLPRKEEYSVESRNLGLITADEIEDIREKINGLRELAEKHIDLDGLYTDYYQKVFSYIYSRIQDYYLKLLLSLNQNLISSVQALSRMMIWIMNAMNLNLALQ